MIGSRKHLMIVALLIAIMFIAAACGNSRSDSESSMNSYIVYKESYEMSASSIPTRAEGNSPDMIVVLPSTANVPANYNTVSNANVTFIQEGASSVSDTVANSTSVNADGNGSFVVPEEILNNRKGDDSGVEIIVSTPDGEASFSGTRLPAANPDNGELPISLIVVPNEFMVLVGEYRVFHALKTTAGGNVVRAKNVKWECDPEATGVLSKVEEAENGEFVVCRGEQTGVAEVTASLNTGGGISATALGHVVSRENLISVEGTVSNSDETLVGAGYLISFERWAEDRVRPFRMAGHTDAKGAYRMFLPATENHTSTSSKNKTK